LLIPEWLAELADLVAARIEPADPRAPIGCHFCEVEGVWEVTLFVSRTEIFGGEFDGQAIPGRFIIDLGGLLSVLDELHGCWWQPFSVAADDELGPHVALEGIYAGHEVWIRVPAQQPGSIPSGRVANMLGGTIERRW